MYCNYRFSLGPVSESLKLPAWHPTKPRSRASFMGKHFVRQMLFRSAAPAAVSPKSSVNAAPSGRRPQTLRDRLEVTFFGWIRAACAVWIALEQGLLSLP